MNIRMTADLFIWNNNTLITIHLPALFHLNTRKGSSGNDVRK